MVKIQYVYFLLFVIIPLFGNGQNLLKNGGFETWVDENGQIPEYWATNVASMRSKELGGTYGETALGLTTNFSFPNSDVYTNYISYQPPYEDVQARGELALKTGNPYKLIFDYRSEHTSITSITISFFNYRDNVEYSQSFNPVNDGNWHEILFEFEVQINYSYNLNITVESQSPDAKILLDHMRFFNDSETTEYAALVSLYDAFNGPNWSHPWNFNEHPSTWSGVTLNDTGDVIQLFLQDYPNLEGSLPSSIEYLPNLTSLYISNYSGEIPEELYTLIKLRSLSLNGALEGEISPSIGNLIFLKKLILQNNNQEPKLTGTLPNTIGQLSHLEEIRLTYQNFTGSIPDEFWNLTNLKTILFYETNLLGTIPPQIGQLSKLTSLDLRGNRISGELPKELGLLTNLQELSLSENEINGTIPSEIGQMVSLQNIGLGENNLIGTIPSTISNLKKLEHLYLWGNNLIGEIPEFLELLPSLKSLSLGENNFTGQIPAFLGNMSTLEDIVLDNLGLTGTIPTGLVNLRNLKALLLDDNNLTGPIPSFDQTSLVVFWIENNKFTFADIEPVYGFLTDNAGEFFRYDPQQKVGEQRIQEISLGSQVTLTVEVEPNENNNYQWRKGGEPITGANEQTYTIESFEQHDEGIYDCVITNTTVSDLTLYRNEIELIAQDNNLSENDKNALIALYEATDGPNWTNSWDLNTDISTWYGVTTNPEGRVTQLYLAGNNLVGTLPQDIGSLTELELLWLENNSLSGIVPTEIGLLNKLQQLFLNRNQFSGELPTEIWQLTNLKTLQLYDNQFTGQISAEIAQLKELQFLALGNNMFSGQLPNEIWQLLSLEGVNLNYCYNMTYEITPQIAQMTQLTSLELNGLDIIGNLPNEFGQLTNLTRLNLGQSNFNEIPPAVFELTNLTYLNMSDNTISDEFPSQITEFTNLYELVLNNNNLSGEIPKEIGQLKNLHRLYLSSNQLTGTVPTEIGTLINLEVLNLGYNEFNGKIPSTFSNLSNLDWFDIDQNQFEGVLPVFPKKDMYIFSIGENNFVFEDFIKNVPNQSNISYSPQNNIGPNIQILIDEEGSYTISVNETKEINNQYQWRKNGVDINGATGPNLVFSTFNSEDIGIYECIITNPFAPELAIAKNPISLLTKDYLNLLNQIKVLATSYSCPNAMNGKISITFGIDQAYDVKLFSEDSSLDRLLLSNGEPIEFDNLSIGFYEIEVDYGYGQFYFQVQVSEPENLSGKSILDTKSKSAKLTVSGSTFYEVMVNNERFTYNTSSTGLHSLDIPLQEGINKLVTTTDKDCQGIIEETIVLLSPIAYPNPAESFVMLTGLSDSPNALFTLSNLAGTVLYSKQITISNGTMELSTDELPSGVYVAQITTEVQDTQIKIVKK